MAVGIKIAIRYWIIFTVAATLVHSSQYCEKKVAENVFTHVCILDRCQRING